MMLLPVFYRLRFRSTVFSIVIMIIIIILLGNYSLCDGASQIAEEKRQAYLSFVANDAYTIGGRVLGASLQVSFKNSSPFPSKCQRKVIVKPLFYVQASGSKHDRLMMVTSHVRNDG